MPRQYVKSSPVHFYSAAPVTGYGYNKTYFSILHFRIFSDKTLTKFDQKDQLTAKPAANCENASIFFDLFGLALAFQESGRFLLQIGIVLCTA